MISIVVCSINNILFNQFEKNVIDTIGCEFEMIRIDNNQSGKGICKVYNEGLLKAKGEIVCYCHEDIIFETDNWGGEITSLLATKEIGLVGIAGPVYKSKYPTSWVAVPQKYYRVNMVQQKRDGSSFYTQVLDEGNYSEVAVLDGCFIAGRKEIFEQNQWNEDFLDGFHLYDLDMSLQIKERYKLVVANHIKLVHLSEGNFGPEWLKESEKFHVENRDRLPVSVNQLRRKEQSELDYFGLNAYIIKLKQLKEPRLKILKYIGKAFLLFPFRRQNLSMLKTVFY